MRGYCQKCGNDGYYFADAVEECHFVKCAHCGKQALETWCPECGVGFTKMLNGKSYSLHWKCEECQKKYILPDDFFNQPVLLYRKEDIPKHLRNEKPVLVRMWAAIWPMLKPTTIRVQITLAIGVILWAAIALVWNKPLDMYHHVLGRDLFFAAMISVGLALPFAAASDTDWNMSKRFDRWASRIYRIMWAVVMVAVIYLGIITSYDWFAGPRQITGQVTSVVGELQYITSHEGGWRKQYPHNWRFSIKLDNNSHTWKVNSPFSREAFYRSLQGKKVVIEYTPAGENVVSVKLAEEGITSNKPKTE